MRFAQIPTARRGGKTARSAVLALLAVLALVLSACAGSGGPEQAESTGSGEVSADTSGTVRILMENVPDTDIVKSMVADFNAEYPGVEINIESLTFDQMRDKLVSSFQSSSPAYDLIVVDNPWMVDFANAKFLQPLDARIDSTPDYDAGDFFTPLTDITTVDGTRYGVPFYNYALGYLYNADDLAAANQQVPTTLDELVSTSKALKSGDRAGIAMQPQRGYKIFEEWGNWLFAAGGSIYDADGKITLNTPEAKRALEAYIDTYNTAAPANSLSWGMDEAQRSVSANQSASMINYNWQLPALNEPGSGPAAGKIKLATIPGGKQVLGSWSWAIPANSATPDAAWAFVSWITAKPNDVVRTEKGGAAIRKSTLQNPAVLQGQFGEEYYRTVEQLLADAAPLTQGPSGEEMIQAVGTALNEAVAGEKSVDDALATAQAEAEKIQG
ncbi:MULTISPECIES: ABC transporter substrate-binding protein [Mycolicibacterium]|uniref:Carbohydrate ABC transporter substrate-binding protein, CUT1 family n=3 Tax=Mycolicibacterium gilvum TaxID=1804 RepID=E6TCG6_MYCSR|nr:MULTISPECIES: sugar ABC transporter substrate-binding protein [Mycolicibacterium]ABP46247.1 carbohydrate ABC transporter substrate-binding protein, CUT1 family [Mycolicibacterium gilvum PYR-GCK]ADT99733.1 carbohydrate ABC transporter substrate-binding protein, CUT1 family [Mycolicibacterium gilvum Spyr1]MBV5244019.1 sugar ABC transporter substrate-binding protein [Mycolicibacterium sp. PAM1]MCV7055346.1 sugar ABC transporter substrate-binding protein [Mycolicibacterium gilvum]STZ43326.1 ext